MKVTLAFLAVVGTALAGCSEYVDGQPQCSSSSAAPAACSEYVDGQPQCSSAAPAPSAACSEYVDGQPQCSSAAPAPVSAAPTSSAGYTYPSVTPPASETSPYIPPVPPHPSCWASTVIPEAGATETIPIPINTCTMKSMYATGSGYGTGYGTGYGAATGTGYGASSTYTGPAIATGNGAQGLPTAAPALLLGAMGVMAML